MEISEPDNETLLLKAQALRLIIVYPKVAVVEVLVKRTKTEWDFVLLRRHADRQWSVQNSCPNRQAKGVGGIDIENIAIPAVPEVALILVNPLLFCCDDGL